MLENIQRARPLLDWARRHRAWLRQFYGSEFRGIDPDEREFVEIMDAMDGSGATNTVGLDDGAALP